VIKNLNPEVSEIPWIENPAFSCGDISPGPFIGPVEIRGKKIKKNGKNPFFLTFSRLFFYCFFTLFSLWQSFMKP